MIKPLMTTLFAVAMGSMFSDTNNIDKTLIQKKYEDQYPMYFYLGDFKIHTLKDDKICGGGLFNDECSPRSDVTDKNEYEDTDIKNLLNEINGLFISINEHPSDHLSDEEGVDDLDVLQLRYQEKFKHIKIKDATCDQLKAYHKKATNLRIGDIYFLDDGSSLKYMSQHCKMFNSGLGKE